MLEMQDGAQALGSRLGLSSVQGHCTAIAPSCSLCRRSSQEEMAVLQPEEWRWDGRIDFLTGTGAQAAGMVSRAESGYFSLLGTIGALNPLGSWV